MCPPRPLRALYPQCLGPESCDLSYRVFAVITIVRGQLWSADSELSLVAPVIVRHKKTFNSAAQKTVFLCNDTFLYFPPLRLDSAELSCGFFWSSFLCFPTVSQLQQTLASVQELLIQQQQKIQELSQELATAEVVPDLAAVFPSRLFLSNPLL